MTQWRLPHKVQYALAAAVAAFPIYFNDISVFFMTDSSGLSKPIPYTVRKPSAVIKITIFRLP